MGFNIRTIERNEWNDLLFQFSDANYRHVWEYCKLAAERTKATSESLLISTSKKTAIADLRIRKLPFLKYGIAYSVGGPLILKPGEKFDSDFYLKVIEALDIYCSKKGLVLRVAPPRYDNSTNRDMQMVCNKLGFLDLSRRNPTMMVDISGSEKDIRSGFKKKWRYYLKKSEKNNLEIVMGTENRFFEDFNCIFDLMLERKAFKLELPVSFYKRIQNTATDRTKYYIILAKHQGDVVAGFVGSFIGHSSIYILGASTQLGLKLNAPYLLQWEAILKAKDRGSKYYDLGGVDKLENPGVYHFKKGLGGELTPGIGPFQSQRKPILSWALLTSEKSIMKGNMARLLKLWRAG